MESLSVGVGACASVATVQADLVSEYTFDNTLANAVGGAPSGTAARTSGRRLKHPLVRCRQGCAGAISFDGDGSYVNTTTNGLPNGSGLVTGTVAFWIQTTNTTAMQKVLSGDNSLSPGYRSFEINTLSGGGSKFYLRPNNDTGDYDWQAAASSAFNGNWHHVALTWNATTGAAGTGSATFYLDGTALTTTVSGTKNISSASTWAAWDYGMFIGVGGRATPNWDPLTAPLDNLQVYNTELTAGQIAALAGVPEPSAATLTVIGLIGLLCYAWRKRK